jgi:hypothetical protein
MALAAVPTAPLPDGWVEVEVFAPAATGLRAPAMLPNTPPMTPLPPGFVVDQAGILAGDNSEKRTACP